MQTSGTKDREIDWPRVFGEEAVKLTQQST
jgi:hypothetical protein